ncbi:hypothetical protein NE236_04720 [Actinoallomurus purpureus]|uniref:DUF7691 family protein n=1 Tax=Actinoallomurus purpureus TaxID=478114 RepID=UPI0020936100|nr:hypothetical protein [Actinoallomurus purpureus]MCO6004276.1 hypothetical protein [Actinoallomurus purpureus]
MSHIITMTTADQSRVVAYLQGGELNATQQRMLRDHIRKDARADQLSLEHQGVDLGLTIPEALDHLLAGHANADGEYVGYAYYKALQHIIDWSGSDPIDFGVYSKPSTFFGRMGDELRRLGVPADLLPLDFLFAGPPDEIPFHVPSPMDGYPAIGRLALARAKPLADAYAAVLDRMDNAFTHEAQRLIDKMRVEHDEWQSALQYGHTMDTLFFSIQG